MKYLRFIFLIFSVFLISACASSKIVDNTTEGNFRPDDEEADFDDWQYMGFGKAFPSWIQALLDNNKGYFIAEDDTLTEDCIFLDYAYGVNVDQAKEKLLAFVKEKYKDENLQVLKETWVRYNVNKFSDRDESELYLYALVQRKSTK